MLENVTRSAEGSEVVVGKLNNNAAITADMLTATTVLEAAKLPSTQAVVDAVGDIISKQKTA